MPGGHAISNNDENYVDNCDFRDEKLVNLAATIGNGRKIEIKVLTMVVYWSRITGDRG